MATVTLARDLPGCPAGTVFTLDRDGNYRDPSGVFWLAPRTVEETPDLVVPRPVDPGTAYHYINDAGAVAAATWQGTQRDESRRAWGNMFRTADEAVSAAARAAAALKRPDAGPLSAAEGVEAEKR